MNNKLNELINKFFTSLFQSGLSATMQKVSLYIQNKIALNKLYKHAFDGFYQAKYLPSNTNNSDVLPICFYNISHIDIVELAAHKPLFINHYLPRIPLLFTENFVERINYHIRIAKEYQIYGFCYEVNNINQFTNFFSNLHLAGVSMPFCISIHYKLTFDNIKTIFKTINYDEYIKHNDKYIIVLDCSYDVNIIDEFINKVNNALAGFNIDYELWLKVPYNTNINNHKISAVINTFNNSLIPPVSYKPLPYISISTQNKLYYYYQVAESLSNHKKTGVPEYNVVINAQDRIINDETTFYKYSLSHFYNWVKRECVYLRKNFEKNRR